MRKELIFMASFLTAGLTAAFQLTSEAPGDAVTIIAPTGRAKAFWAQWRGPSGQGLVEGTGYRDSWSDPEGILWRVPVPGSGNSSPIVWEDHIFLTTSYDGGARLSLLCFSTEGRKLWETFVPQEGVEHAHAKNGHASATPVTDGQTVYASFGTHGLVAFDFDGKILWQRKLGALDNYHGSAGSPVLYRDSVILYQDHRGTAETRSFVAALDKQTGKTLWSTERAATTGWGTPIVIRAGARDELVVSSQHRVNAYDPATGRELWTVSGNLFEVIPTPVVAHGLVFCASGRAGPTLAIRPGGTGDVTETHVVWKNPKGSPFVPSPVVYGDHLYMVNDMQSVATCFEAKTGKLMWQGRLGDAPREGFSSSPIAMNGKVFITNDLGETFVVEAGAEFKILRVNRLNGRTLATPALVGGRWYFRTDKELLSIG